ncbi:uncharacterized protein LOC105203824 [Solenopsis invicta]|uniref:uncharacterized protein LOC105203824 n=1 Tax=Solenopsis invicta TaxID=13686 RepID=UPI0005958C60|nr:uncharacterized protein LOC105203824 [Solenopsis invicta]
MFWKMLFHRRKVIFVWKMFTVFFIFAFVTTHALEEIPSYIHVCGLKDPNYDQCVMENMNNVKDKICKGFSEFNVPPSEPLNIKKIIIYDTNELKLYIKDVAITNFCDYVVNSVNTDSDRLHFSFDVTFKNFIIDALYNFDLHVLVSLAHEGPVHIQANSSMKIDLDAKVATKNGKKEIYAAKIKSNLYALNFEYTFPETGEELVQLHQAIRNAVDGNKKDVRIAIKPIIENSISQVIMTIFNGITRSNYQKLFPE